jgi:uncharacterized membrane protein YjjB (DUF3815 family)
MLSIPVTIVWFLFLIAILWAFQRVTSWFTQLNIFSLFLCFLIMRHGLTVPFDHTVNHWYAGIDLSPAAYTRFYLSLVLMWVCLLVGAWFGRIVLGPAQIDPKKFRLTMRQPVLPAGINRLFVVAVLAGAAFVVIFEVQFKASPWKLLTGGLTSVEYRAMRDSYGVATHYSASLGNHIASIVRFGLFPSFICTLYFMSSRGWPWRLLFLFVLGLGLLVGLISGQKGASIFLLISLGIAHYYNGQLQIRLTNWRIWVLGGFGVMTVVFLYGLQYPGKAFNWVLHATLYRLTSESDRSLQLYFQIYPDVQPFLHGCSSSLINSMLGINMPVDQLPERFIPTYYLGHHYLNTWNGAFIGVAWADFGYAGVVVESLFVGLLLYAYACWFSRVRKTALVMGTQVGLMMAATRLSEVALTANLLSFGLLSSFLVYWVVRSRQEVSKSEVQLPHANPSNCT